MEELHSKNNNNLVFYWTLIYLFIFYFQLGMRIPILGTIRIELLFGSLLLTVIFIKLLSKKLSMHNNKLNVYFATFFIFLFITIPFAYVKSHALDTFIHILKLFAIYLMIITSITDEEKLKKFLWIYVLMIALLFLEPFTYAIRGEGFRYNSGAMRLFGYGLWSHPNTLGGITASNLPFFYFLFLYEKSIFKRIFLISLMLIALSVIFFTSSRTAFIGFLTFCLLLWTGSKRKIFATVMLAVFLIGIWQFAPVETKTRFLTLKEIPNVFSPEEAPVDAMSNRWELIKIAVKVFEEYPIIGVGIGNFIAVSGQEYGMWLPSHNLYAQLISEIGVVGTLIFFLIILKINSNLRQASSQIKASGIQNSFLEYMIRSVQYFLIIRLVIGMFGDDLIENYWALTGSLSVVLLDIARQKRQTLAEDRVSL